MKPIRVLVACEESQRVTEALRNRGVEAFSCDILPCSGNHPEWHIMQDVLPLLNGDCTFTLEDGSSGEQVGKWDCIIAFPPCTYMSIAGACRTYPIKGVINQERYQKGVEGAEFFMSILNADCDKIAVENPTPMKVFNLPKHTQVIQPYEHGHPFTKRTLLWLKNLPELVPSNLITEDVKPFVNGGSKNSKGAPRKSVGTKDRSSVDRSKTFFGIAQAMADQWF